MSGLSDLMTATAMASELTGVATGDFGVTPNPVYYGTGCAAGQSTQLIAYLSTTGAWTRDMSIPEGSTVGNIDVSFVYEYLDVPTTLGIPGKVTPIFSKSETIPGYWTAMADLSTETFTGQPGILMIDYFVYATFLKKTSPFTITTSTEIVYNSGYISVPVLPCGEPTPTPEPVSYRGSLTFSPADVVYKGSCSSGEPEELTVEVKLSAPITDPAIEQWVVLRYYPISTGKLLGDISYKMTKVGDSWKAVIKTSDWTAITEDGYIHILLRAQKGEPALPTILQEWDGYSAGYKSGLALSMCKPPAPTLTITCPPDLKQTSADSAGMPVYYGFPTVTSTCPGAWYFNCTPPSGSTFPVGSTSVNCSVVDSCGYTASCAFNTTIFYTPSMTYTPGPQYSPTDTPVPLQVIPTNTPFNCSKLDMNSCTQGPYANVCQWVQDQNNPNGVCKNR
jgi:hypothetical protein